MSSIGIRRTGAIWSIYSRNDTHRAIHDFMVESFSEADTEQVIQYFGDKVQNDLLYDEGNPVGDFRYIQYINDYYRPSERSGNDGCTVDNLPNSKMTYIYTPINTVKSDCNELFQLYESGRVIQRITESINQIPKLIKEMNDVKRTISYGARYTQNIPETSKESREIMGIGGINASFSLHF